MKRWARVTPFVMKHGFNCTILILVVLVFCFFSVCCKDGADKSRLEKIKEIVAKNMHILGPMLKTGPSKEMVDFYLKVGTCCIYHP